MKIAGKDLINNEIVDTVVLARDKFPGSSNSLDALCKRYKIDNSRRVKHTALIDCELLSKVFHWNIRTTRGLQMVLWYITKR